MQIIKYLEVFIALSFIYLLLSLFSSILMEYFATLLRLRATTLKETIAKMLGESKLNDKLVTAFYNLPIIKTLGDQRFIWGSLQGNSMPHDIDVKSFVSAMLQLLNNSRSNGNSAALSDQLIEHNDLLNREIKDQLLHYWNKAKGVPADFERELEEWYHLMMLKTTAWYKRKVQYVLIFIGFILALLFNGDTLRLVSDLYQQDEVRQELVKSASDYIKNNAPPKSVNQSQANDTSTSGTTPASDSILRMKIDSLNIEIASMYKRNLQKTQGLLGWQDTFSTISRPYLKATRDSCASSKKCTKLHMHYSIRNLSWFAILGYLLTGLAISMGANFWFDMLKKLFDVGVLIGKK